MRTARLSTTEAPAALPQQGMPAVPGADQGMAPGRYAPATSRLAWVDYARGLAIILVVWGHCFRGVAEAGIVPPGSILYWVDGIIYSFHNPLFFFLSGAFARNSATLAPRQFWAGRMAVIAWPYVLWMSVALALMTLLAGSTNSGRITVGVATYLYEPIAPFWFLYCLLAANLFQYAVGGLGRWTMLALAALAYVVGQAIGGGIVLPVSWGVFYFCLGAGCADWVRHPAFIRTVSRPAVLAMLGAGTVLASAALLHWGVSNQLMLPASVLGSAFMFGIAAPLSQAAVAAPALRVVGTLGRISLTVLVVHVLATAGTRIALVRLLHIETEWLHLVAGMAMGLGFPLALQAVAARLGVLRLAGLSKG